MPQDGTDRRVSGSYSPRQRRAQRPRIPRLRGTTGQPRAIGISRTGDDRLDATLRRTNRIHYSPAVRPWPAAPRLYGRFRGTVRSGSWRGRIGGGRHFSDGSVNRSIRSSPGPVESLRGSRGPARRRRRRRRPARPDGMQDVAGRLDQRIAVDAAGAGRRTRPRDRPADRGSGGWRIGSRVPTGSRSGGAVPR